MVGLELADNRDVGGLFEVPELEAGEFVNDDVGRGEVVEDVDGGFADVTDEVDILVFFGVEQRFDE